MPDVSSPARRIVASRSLPPPRFAYSPVVLAGGFAFVSGLVGLDPATGALASGGAAAETARVLANMRALADEHGWPLDRLVLVRLFCSDFSRFGEVNHAWETFFDGVVPPARTSVGVSALPLGALVEMEFQFVVDPAPR